MQEIILRLKNFTRVNFDIPEGYREKCSIHRENYTRFTNMDGGGEHPGLFHNIEKEKNKRTFEFVENRSSPKGYKRNAWDNLLFESHSQHLELLKIRTASDMDKDYSEENVVSSNLSSKTDPLPPLESIERAAERNSRQRLQDRFWKCQLYEGYFTVSVFILVIYFMEESPIQCFYQAFALLLIKKDVCSSETKKGLLQKVKHTVSAAARDSLKAQQIFLVPENTYITNLEFEVHYYIICKASGLTISQVGQFNELYPDISHCLLGFGQKVTIPRYPTPTFHCIENIKLPFILGSAHTSDKDFDKDKVKKGIRERLTGTGGSLKTRENRVSTSGSTWLKALRSKKEDDDIKIVTEYAYKYCTKTEAEEQKYNLKLHVFLIPIGFSVLSAIDSSSSGHYTSDAYNI
ncbi:hypothetical protein EI555_002563 [Monodon monoceros]|uniref:Uncharacterized protein n=1 Tax=Monodon monoceros TaxID=40151 RepID=A0A4U1ECY0_MONMO|nr:hypothetical protein EI555_002563 [Monodon monoceros]